MVPITLSLQIKPEEGIAVLKVQGELNLEDRREFLSGLDKLIDCTESRMVVDFSGAWQMSSLYIGTLMDFVVRTKALDKAVVIIVRPQEAKVCRHTGLDKVAQIVEIPSSKL